MYGVRRSVGKVLSLGFSNPGQGFLTLIWGRQFYCDDKLAARNFTGRLRNNFGTSGKPWYFSVGLCILSCIHREFRVLFKCESGHQVVPLG